jgi:hypothetical protein
VSGVGDGVDRRVEPGSRADVAAKTAARLGTGSFGAGGRAGGNFTKRFDGKDVKVRICGSSGIDELRAGST